MSSRTRNGRRGMASAGRGYIPSVDVDSSQAATGAAVQIEQYRSELTGYCYRMLGSPFDAEDAVQDTLLRAWRGLDSFEGRAALRSWLYRIATNVCLDMLKAGQRRARPMDLGPAREPVAENLNTLPEVTWVEPIPDPALVTVERETVRLAFVAALQHLPPRQRAVLILCEVLHWQASEVAELLETSVASANSALQRARTTLARADLAAPDLAEVERGLLERYVAAFEAYDIEALTALIREDASQSMPPYDMWLAGRDDILAWWFGPRNRLPRLARDPDRRGQWGTGIRTVQAEPDWRLRAVGSPGARGDGWPDRRVHVLPRHRAALPTLRPPRPTRVLVALGKDAAETEQGDEADQLPRCMLEPYLTAMPPRGQLKPHERLHGHHVRGDAGDVAERELGIALLQHVADARAESRQVAPSDRAVNGNCDRSWREVSHRQLLTAVAAKSHRSAAFRVSPDARTDEFRAVRSSSLWNSDLDWR